MSLPLMVVDAPSLLYRAFYALPDSIRDGDGNSVNALLGSTNLILQELDAHPSRAVVMCFGAEAAVYRKELLSAYHAERPEMPEKLVHQWADAVDFFGAFGWQVEKHETLEADDLLGSFAEIEAAAGGKAYLLTGDRDMFQCATKDITVLYVSTGGKRGAAAMGPKEVKERYGIPPDLVPDFIALRGDPSDGIPGAKGVGEKTAAELLNEHGSLENLLDNAMKITKPKLRTTLTSMADELREFKDIATLRDAGVKRPKDAELDTKGAAAAARKRGMNRLAERLEKLQETP